MISVLTPSLNYRIYLEDCLKSVAGQGREDVEHVVADGGSTDGTTELLKQLGNQTSWFSEPDSGQSDALTKALAHSGGEWIGWLNADEFYLPGALDAVAPLMRRPSVDVVYGDYAFVDAEGALLRLVPQHRFSEEVLRWYGPFIGSCAFFVRRSLAARCGWDQGLRKVMDWDFMLRLNSVGARFDYLPRLLGAYRIHEQQVTAALVPINDPEKQIVRQRWGLPRAGFPAIGSRISGRLVHGAFKLIDGAYRRQLVARDFRGSSLRWFASDRDAATTASLLDRLGIGR